jgi:uncharacterized protein YukE
MHSMTKLQVDPAILRRFATVSDQTSTAVRSARLAAHVGELAAALPSSSTAFPAGTAQLVIDQAVTTCADYYSAMGRSVRVGADTYQATDDDLATRLNAIAPRPR